MLKNFGNIPILWFILSLNAATTFSQTEVKPVYKLLDSAIHIQNTDLANGTEYIDQHIIKSNHHKYFQTQKYLNGNVLYDDQPYYDLDLQYNIYDDLLLVRIPTTGGATTINLHKSKVKAFNIENHSFISLSASPDEKPQFYEILLDSDDILLLKKHHKKLKKHLDQNFAYFEFKEDSPEYFVSIENTLSKIDSRRSIRKLFPNKEEQIENFYRNNSRRQKSDQDEFLTALFQNLAPSTSKLNLN
ncbi:hypothetical protein [Salinimicrobium sp. WS361]|uniref:hypothetical protein n=1 Tax=Salinimicrobium sp. WS361 TaxID=3425123 RepID=UPI003D6DB08B